MNTPEARRKALINVRAVVRQYETHNSAGPDIMRGVRYDLAIRATDLNGDGCMFPACHCNKADCSLRPTAKTLEWTP